MNQQIKIDIKDMSQAERILLVEQIWDSIAFDKDSIEVTEPQKLLLEERLADYYFSPNDGCSWEDVKKEMK